MPSFPDTTAADPYAAALRALSPARKLEVAQQLRATAWELTAAGVRLRDPALSEIEVQDRVRRIFLHATT